MPFIGSIFPFVIPLIRKKIPIVGNEPFSSVYPAISERVRILGRGFTLIELVITMTVIGILAIIAVPSYQNFVESNRLTAATNDLVADLSFIRVEAMKRGASTPQVEVCASSDGASCTTGSTTWASGWIVFLDADSSGTYNTGDTLLKIHSAPANSLTAVTIPASTNTIIFNRMGSITNSITSVQFKDTKINNLNRTICISGGTGRAMVAESSVSCP